jgi:hypothetical protein
MSLWPSVAPLSLVVLFRWRMVALVLGGSAGGMDTGMGWEVESMRMASLVGSIADPPESGCQQ